MIELTLPWPPSVNRYWRTFQGRMIISADGRAYRKGAGRELILGALMQIKATKPEITTFVTLSPKTEMARDFHLKNGATIYRENADTINYQYR